MLKTLLILLIRHFSVKWGTLSTDSDNTYLISNIMRITSNTDEFINYK